MRSLAYACLALTLAGCAGTPCDTAEQCASSEVCAAGECAALKEGDLLFAVDPASGSCRPLPPGDAARARSWRTCKDPCSSVSEYGCVGDPRCQPVYRAPPAPNGGGVPLCNSEGCASPRVPLQFAGCRANPLPLDRCAALAAADCAGHANCAVDDQSGACRSSRCSDFTGAACAQHPGCEAFADPRAADRSIPGCRKQPCASLDERGCLDDGACHPVGGDCYCPRGASCNCAGGSFARCDDDDQRVRCESDRECGGGERCNVDEGCLPPVSGAPLPFDCKSGPCPAFSAIASCVGACVPIGCAGYGEARCAADPKCAPVEVLNCQPYCGGQGGGLGPKGGGELVAGTCGCAPTFARCEDQPGDNPIVTVGKSVLIRDPQVVDAPEFAFDRVMAKLAGGDAAPLVNDWLGQIASDLTAGGRTVPARPGMKRLLASLPRRGDGRFEPSALGLRVTSLANRLDLATDGNCGEARITYARHQQGGTVDPTDRMTVIVELQQPDDGAGCRLTAQRWLALSTLDGAALASAAEAIYEPLLDRTLVDQVRTNELARTGGDPTLPWELREWRFGVDGRLHLAPSKQAVDPLLVPTPAFQAWLAGAKDDLLAGRAVVPEGFLAYASSEDGARAAVGGGPVDRALNAMSCAGCHLTETNNAFVHVGERPGGGRARVSNFVNGELAQRVGTLMKVARGGGAWRPATRALIH